jgi:competence ComEA-like helix-hairpin-helix protein
VALYTRHQLILLLAVLAAGAVGLGVRQWRASFPELAERLETLDRAPQAEWPEPAAAGARSGMAAPASLGRGAPPQEGPGPRARGRAELRASVRTAPPPAPTSSPSTPVDVNRATAEELRRLPGLGPVLAARIVEARETQGRFERVDDLRRVRGIGPATLERLRPLLTVGD